MEKPQGFPKRGLQKSRNKEIIKKKKSPAESEVNDRSIMYTDSFHACVYFSTNIPVASSALKS